MNDLFPSKGLDLNDFIVCLNLCGTCLNLKFSKKE